MVSGDTRHRRPSSGRSTCQRGLTLCLRRDGEIAGVCRVDPATGLIDGPGILTAHRGDLSCYEDLLAAAMALAGTASITVESWGEGPERTAVCERLGLVTTEYTGGWEYVLSEGSRDVGRPDLAEPDGTGG